VDEVDEADDDDLMAQVGRRDQAAYGSLVARHLSSVHRYLTRLTASPADADELAQETLLRMWLHAESYRPGTVRLTTWLHRIAHNLAVDELRKRRTEPLQESHIPADAGADPQAALAASQAQSQLNQALDSLPANQRAALLLTRVQEFSSHDAATILGVSVHSVESLVARGRRTLRARLQQLQGDTPEPQQSNPT